MIQPDILRAFIEANPRLVTRKQSITHPELYVLKYHRRVFYDNLWDDAGILRECRGLVVDADYNVVVQPFTKIFNRHENDTDIPADEIVTAVEKINGFMGAYTHDIKYGRIYSTTGSLDSEFVALVKKHLTPLEKVPVVPNTTYLFEICDETDPHIIVEEPGAYLIGAISTHDGKSHSQERLDCLKIKMHSHGFDVKRPDWLTTTFKEVVEQTKACRHEGFVVYGEKVALKIKSPYYLTTKLLGRMNPDKLLKCLDNKQFMHQSVDEEFYPIFDKLVAIKDDFIKLEPSDRVEVVRDLIQEHCS